MAGDRADKMQDRGKLMRERAVSAAMKRKEEYLGARVSKELRDKVILRAKHLGIPVSILIRNILVDAFRDEESIATTGVGHDTSGDLKNRFSNVLGWESIVLNRDVSCSGCGRSLNSGMSVTLGLGGNTPVVLCSSCKEQI